MKSFTVHARAMCFVHVVLVIRSPCHVFIDALQIMTVVINKFSRNIVYSISYTVDIYLLLLLLDSFFFFLGAIRFLILILVP